MGGVHLDSQMQEEPPNHANYPTRERSASMEHSLDLDISEEHWPVFCAKNVLWSNRYGKCWIKRKGNRFCAAGLACAFMC